MDTHNAARALPPGTKLFGYEIVEKLGSGAFGIVYRATLLEIGGTVAIKEFLPAQLARRRDDWHVEPLPDQVEAFQWSLEHFRKEARTLHALAKPTPHPNIVKVELVFETNDTVYFSMQWEEGRPLDQVLGPENPWSESRLRALLLPLLDGLHRVHAAQVLHRDIKPSNILVRPDGSPVLIDFGAARRDVGDPNQSRFIVQTPGYAPPEQTWGEYGPWTDIYALGASVFFLLTGSMPIAASERRRLLSKELAGTYSQQFLHAIDAALEPDHRLRPQTVEEWRLLFEPQTGSSDTVVMPHPHPLVHPAETASARTEVQSQRAPAGAPARGPQDETLVQRPAAPASTGAATRPQRSRGSLLVITALIGVSALGAGVWLWKPWLPGDGQEVGPSIAPAPEDPWQALSEPGATRPQAGWLEPRPPPPAQPTPAAEPEAPPSNRWAETEQQGTGQPDAAWLDAEPDAPATPTPAPPPEAVGTNPWAAMEQQALQQSHNGWLARESPQSAAHEAANPWAQMEQQARPPADPDWLPSAAPPAEHAEDRARGTTARQPEPPPPRAMPKPGLTPAPARRPAPPQAPATIAKAEPPTVPVLPPAADSIRAAIATLDCARVDLEEVGPRSFELHGHVATRATLADLRAALRRIPSIRVDIGGIEVLSAPVCATLAALEPYLDTRAPEIRPNHPDGRYVIGDPFGVEARNRDRSSGRLHLFFVSAADEVMAFPNSFRRLLYKDGIAREAGFDIGGPVGADLILAVWCRGGTELPESLATEATTASFLPELQNVLDETGNCSVSYAVIQVLPASQPSARR